MGTHGPGGPAGEDAEAHRAERARPGQPAHRGRARTHTQVLGARKPVPFLPQAEQMGLGRDPRSTLSPTSPRAPAARAANPSCPVPSE